MKMYFCWLSVTGNVGLNHPIPGPLFRRLSLGKINKVSTEKTLAFLVEFKMYSRLKLQITLPGYTADFDHLVKIWCSKKWQKCQKVNWTVRSVMLCTTEHPRRQSQESPLSAKVHKISRHGNWRISISSTIYICYTTLEEQQILIKLWHLSQIKFSHLN